MYLRSTTASKPMAPLKLYASVMGKFTVERQLDDKVRDRVRQQIVVEKQQRVECRANLLDQPPILASGAKNIKREIPGSGSVIPSQKTAATKQLPAASSSTVALRKESTSAQNAPSTKAKANPELRRQLIHYLASSPRGRLVKDVVKKLGGANLGTAAHKDMLALLKDVSLIFTIHHILMRIPPRLPNSH